MRLTPASIALAALALSSIAHAQTWTPLVRAAPSNANLMLLLSDGTVMACNNGGAGIGRAWYRLTPDSHGSYVNGTWTTLASMIDTRLYFSSQVLMSGKVLVAGGEYGTGGSKSEVYDPVANTWTATTIPTSVLDPAVTSPVTGLAQGYLDSNSEITANGNVIVTPVSPKYSGQTVIYNPGTNAWTNGPNLFRGAYQDEASWVKLADDTILTIDPFGTNSERYNPVTNTWINDGVVPVSLYDPFGSELGAALLLAGGKAFFIGSTGHTALYTPTGTTAPGTWAAGPDVPGAHGAPDAPAAVMVNGKVLCAVSPVPTSGTHFPTPTTFYEYDPVANSFGSVTGPTGASDAIPSYRAQMLVLPNGAILYSHMGTDLYTYTPAGAALAAGKPAINSITANGDGSYHLTGTGLNGLNEGAGYGDDCQMNSNYPIVRINHSNGNTYYARTFNWSSTSVMTGTRILTTEYRLPASMPAGVYTLVEVANGIPSDPATRPTVTSQPVSAIACFRGTVSFSTAATGTPVLTYQWKHGATSLVDGGRISGAHGTTLTISQVTSADAGLYSCTLTNALGTVGTSVITLTVCVADVDDGSGTGTCDQGVTIDDLLFYLALFSNGDPRSDVDDGSGTGTPDSGVTIDDLLYYLARFVAGC